MRPSRFCTRACNFAGIVAVEAQSDMSFPRHTHDQFGIGLIDRGAQKSSSGRGIVEAGEGDVITVNPGEVHDGAPIGGGGRQWRMLYFDTGVLRELLASVAQGSASRDEFSFPALRAPEAVCAFVRGYRAAVNETTVDGMDFEEAMLLLLPALFDKAIAVPEKASASEIRLALQRVNDNPASPVTLSELSEISGVEKFRLIRVFAGVTGLTPHRFVLQERVHLARRLIAAGRMLAEAAHESGFSDQAHMTRHFVRNYGFTPGNYAAAVRRSAK